MKTRNHLLAIAGLFLTATQISAEEKMNLYGGAYNVQVWEKSNHDGSKEYFRIFNFKISPEISTSKELDNILKSGKSSAFYLQIKTTPENDIVGYAIRREDTSSTATSALSQDSSFYKLTKDHYSFEKDTEFTSQLTPLKIVQVNTEQPLAGLLIKDELNIRLLKKMGVYDQMKEMKERDAPAVKADLSRASASLLSSAPGTSVATNSAATKLSAPKSGSPTNEFKADPLDFIPKSGRRY